MNIVFFFFVRAAQTHGSFREKSLLSLRLPSGRSNDILGRLSPIVSRSPCAKLTLYPYFPHSICSHIEKENGNERFRLGYSSLSLFWLSGVGNAIYPSEFEWTIWCCGLGALTELVLLRPIKSG